MNLTGKSTWQSVLILLLASIFTIGLMFASIELPKVLDRFLGERVGTLDVATGQNDLSDVKTELFLSHYHIRLIGYICLGLVLVFIVLGFVLEKRGLASAGAILLFLPVFGHFAATMFFLGGLAFLRFLWLPFLDISFDIMRLGDIIVLPYKWLLDLASLVGLNIYGILPFVITGLGAFIFLVGVLTWMSGRFQKKNVADFWIYRLSRHPQYLGWIMWSYGILFLPGANIRNYISIANTLPWLLTTMIIIAIALLEERLMRQKYGEEYEAYQRRVSFPFPLPRFVRSLFLWPIKLVFKQNYPQRKREIVTLVAFSSLVLIVASAFYSGLVGWPGQTDSHRKISRCIHTIRTTSHRGEIREAANWLADEGGAGVDSLIAVLNHPNLYVRWYCADALGHVKSEKVIQPLVSLLNDPDANVRRTATGSLGETGCTAAVPILITAFQDSTLGVESTAAYALGKLQANEALPLLINGLRSENGAIIRACLWALGEMAHHDALQPLLDYCNQNENCEFLLAGDALVKLGSEHAVDIYTAGLESDKWWVQCGCARALGETGSPEGIAPLNQAYQRGNERLRRAAIFALSHYPLEQVKTVLTDALADDDWEVRLYAKASLDKTAE